MKKFMIAVCVIVFSCPVFADDVKEVQAFFNEYINAANSYSENYFDYYTENPTIIRVVEKKDGTKKVVKVPFERYKKEALLSGKLAKIRRYKNKYFNIKITKLGKDYKIAAMRMPSTSDYKVSAYFIVEKDDTGKWKIKEESMNTRVQIFLEQGWYIKKTTI